jgi:hypothetical protein
MTGSNKINKNSPKITSPGKGIVTLEEVRTIINNETTKIIKSAESKILNQAKKEIDKQVQTDKVSLMTIFGLFASMLAFLTTEFQFLKTINSFQKILGFTLILSAFLLSFNIALDYLVKSRLDKKTPRPSCSFTGSIIILFVIGLGFTFFGNEEIGREHKIYQRYSDEFENKQHHLSKTYDKKIKDLECGINQLKNKITLLKLEDN